MESNRDLKVKRLLFLSTRAFWKMDGGHQYEIYHYLRGIHEQYKYEIFVFTFVDNEESDNEKGIPTFVKEVKFADHIEKSDILKNIAKHFIGVKKPWTLQNMLFYSKKNQESINEFAKRINPSAIYVDMVRLAPYINGLKEYNTVKVLGYDDLLSERYKKQLKTKSKNSHIAGAYTDKMSSGLSKLQDNAFVKNIILRYEAKKMEEAELYYSKVFDSGIFVSAIETEKFNAKIGRDFAHTVSMGIDFKYQAEEISVEKEHRTMSFVGNMKTTANYESLVNIIENVLPRIKNEYKFYVIGICPMELVDKYKSNNIIFVGRVDDLREHIKKTEVFLTPIAFGTGIKTKILEAFAMGMPVVTNLVGVEGIEAENGKHCFIADDPTEIAGCVDLLFDNAELRSKLAKNAQKLAEEKYQWEENWKSFVNAGL